ncbi:sulfatase [bacterium]|nr:sulfatase [bacterium]
MLAPSQKFPGIPRRVVTAALCGWLTLAALLAPLGCSGTPSSPSFLILSVDTLRADHLGSYGYSRETSPNLDRFANRSVRFENAFAPAPWTLPSHVALLTGRHPYEVGIVDYQSSIPTEVSLVSESLATAGYQTAAFVDSAPSGLLGADRGFSRGFDVFRHAPHAATSRYRYDMATTVDAGLGWLEERDPSRPFFLFLHTKSVHTTPTDPLLLAESDAPYDKPQPFRTRFLPSKRMQFRWSEGREVGGVIYLRTLNDRIADGSFDRRLFPQEKIEELVGLYDGGIYYFDEQFQRLLEGIEALELAEDTVIVVVADHGEAFLDHRFFLHKEVYAPLLRVPLIVHDPREPGGRVVSQRVALGDVAPTVLDIAGLPLPDGVTGRSLPMLDGEAESPRPLVAYFYWEDEYFYQAFSLLDGPWKLVYHKLASWPEFRTELYDTRADPRERLPLSGETEREQAMLGRLLQWVEEQRPAEAHRIELDPESIEALRALGYLE